MLVKEDMNLDHMKKEEILPSDEKDQPKVIVTVFLSLSDIVQAFLFSQAHPQSKSEATIKVLISANACFQARHSRRQGMTSTAAPQNVC